MKNIDRLFIPDEFKTFETALYALRELDLMASNPVLPANYAITIQSWREAWLQLFMAWDHVTYPNKIHIINHHLEVIFAIN